MMLGGAYGNYSSQHNTAQSSNAYKQDYAQQCYEEQVFLNQVLSLPHSHLERNWSSFKRTNSVSYAVEKRLANSMRNPVLELHCLNVQSVWKEEMKGMH